MATTRDENPYASPSVSIPEAERHEGVPDRDASIFWYVVPLFCLTFACSMSFAVRHPAFQLQVWGEVQRCLLRAASYAVIGWAFHSGTNQNLHVGERTTTLRVGSALVFAAVPFLIEHGISPNFAIPIGSPFFTIVCAMLASKTIELLIRKQTRHPARS